MVQSQVSVPFLACPRCLATRSVHEIDGEPQIARHVRRCDAPRQAAGFVEAAELAGVSSQHWHPEWREYVLRTGDFAGGDGV